MEEIFFVWGSIENEYREQLKERIRDELRLRNYSEDEIDDYLNEVGLL